MNLVPLQNRSQGLSRSRGQEEERPREQHWYPCAASKNGSLVAVCGTSQISHVDKVK